MWNLPAEGGQILRAAGCRPFEKVALPLFRQSQAAHRFAVRRLILLLQGSVLAFKLPQEPEAAPVRSRFGHSPNNG